jgi:hypothetical protein
VKPPVPVKVKLVIVAILKIVVAAVVLVRAMLPEPKEIARVDEPDELKMPVDNVKLARASVPAVKVKVFVIPSVDASPRVTVPPVAFTVTEPNVLPPVVSVPVAVKVNVPEYVNVCPATKVTLPATEMAAVPAIVPVWPVQVIDLAPVLPVEIVQVPVDKLEKNTSSADVGMA